MGVLAQELAAEDKQPLSRQLAGIQLKNALFSKVSSLDHLSPNKIEIRNTLILSDRGQRQGARATVVVHRTFREEADQGSGNVFFSLFGHLISLTF